MGSITFMAVGIIFLLSLTIMPSSAQQASLCWENITPCLETARAQNYAPAALQPCCPAISSAVMNDTACFCLARTDIVSQRNARNIYNNIIFTTCEITTTFDAICPDTTSPTPSESPSTPDDADTPSPTPSEAPSTPDDADTPSPTPSPSPSTPDAEMGN
ncbi:uncharacterized protein [Spinacia oleracea]|uniref:Uncharacterized protein isoform X2 n=1 Tax=Spinacia oleracea TaxID=3562 RepID=A0A9R0K9J8_SPIOL|nr:uncharacterized protein LOC110802534 isoform X2 [Spinacia oleracea]